MRPNAAGQKANLDDRQYVDGAPYFNAAAFVQTPQFAFGNALAELGESAATVAFWSSLSISHV